MKVDHYFGRAEDEPLPCVRCGKPGTSVWVPCADKKPHVLCEACDLEANEWLLRFLGLSRPAWRMSRYRRVMDTRPVTVKRMKLSGLLPIA